MILRAATYAAAVGVLFAAVPSAWGLLLLLPVGAAAVALAAGGRLRPWSDLAAAAAAVACAFLAGVPPGGPLGFAAVGAVVVLAAAVILPSASAPRPRVVPAGLAWLSAGALVGVGVWLPAWMASRGSPALLDPVTGPGLLVRSGVLVAALAIALVAWSALRRATRKLGQAPAVPGQRPGQV